MNKQAVVIHGLGRTAFAMRSLAGMLRDHGYAVTNLNYPSRRLAIPELSATYVKPALEQAAARGRIDIITHSLGGILFRYYLAYELNQQVTDQLGRAVMLAPPNHGSEIPDRLRHWPLVNWIMGPNLAALSTDPLSVPKRLNCSEPQNYPCEIGIIAGNRSLEPWFSPWMSGKNDGKVSVASTRLAGMADHLEVAVGHTFIMNDPQVHRQIRYFLDNGCFCREA